MGMKVPGGFLLLQMLFFSEIGCDTYDERILMNKPGLLKKLS